MRPTIRPSDTQEFWGLSSDIFEDLCSDLHGMQEGIETCQLFGPRGQTQYGVDHVARRRGGSGVEVGQSKCYREFSAKDLKNATKPFLDFIDFWKPWDVRRFILFVACDVNKTQVLQEESSQKEAFLNIGVLFELWDGRNIQRKLAPHRHIVNRYIASPEIQNIICGDPRPDVVESEQGYRRLRLEFEAVSSQNLVISNALSQTKNAELERIREIYREGRQRQALREILQLCNEDAPEWRTIDVQVRGRILRTKALYLLNVENDVTQATAVAQKAKDSDPVGDDAIVRAMITYHTDGPEAALKIAESSDSAELTNLRAGLLLELGRPEGALSLVESLVESSQVGTEAKRLKCIASLASRDLVEARTNIELAFSEKPGWYSVRFARALVDYSSCISLPYLKISAPLAPLPVPFDYVKRDANSLSLLDRAAIEFERLAGESEVGEEERRRVNIWRLAALAIHPQRQDEAEKYCVTLLNAQPVNPFVIRWAVERNYAWDRKALLESMEGEAAKESRDLDAISVTIVLLLEEGKHYQAFALLDKTKRTFEKLGFHDVWLFWLVHAQIASGKKLAEVRKTVKLIKSEEMRRRISATVLKGEYQQTGNWQPLLNFFESAYEESHDVTWLLEACYLKVHLKDYLYVLDHSEKLIDGVGTASMIYLLSSCAWQARRPKLCIQILEKGRRFFAPDLPDDLRRLRGLCYYKLGYLPEAVAEAKDLASQTGKPHDIATYLETQFSMGDFDGVVGSARKLLGSTDVDSAILIGASHILLVIDETVSRALLERALDQGITDTALLGTAIDVAFRLGLESSRTAELSSRLREAALRGDEHTRMLTLPEVLGLGKNWASQRQHLAQLYGKGEAPVHVLSDMLNMPLSSFYHQFLEHNRSAPDPLSQGAVYARFGGRTLFDYAALDPKEWRVHLDISALLLAKQLDLLPLIVGVFGELFIPSTTQAFLAGEMLRLAPHQPSRVENQRRIRDLLTAGSLHVLKNPTVGSDETEFAKRIGQPRFGVLSYVKFTGSYMVDFLPMLSVGETPTPLNLPDEYGGNVTDVVGLVEALVASKLVSDGEKGMVIERLSGAIQGQQNRVIPSSHSVIVLMPGIAEVLASAGILSHVCGLFETSVLESEVREIDNFLSMTEENASTSRWIEDLIQHIRDGLESGAYHLIVLDDSAYSRLGDEKQENRPAGRSMTELFGFGARPGDVLWCDDRYLNSFTAINAMPVLSVTDVLGLLKHLKKIDEASYYSKLIQLRASNIRYIPFVPGEILFWLEKAPREGLILTETAELAVLRRHWAACLLDTLNLQSPPRPDQPKNEAVFVVSSQREINNSLSTLWIKKRHTEEAAIACSNWILEWLFTGLFGTRHLVADSDPRSDRTDLIGFDLGGLMVQALSLTLKTFKDGTDKQSAYLHWLSTSLLRTRLLVDPEVAVPAAAMLKSILEPMLHGEEQGGAEVEKMTAYVIRKLLFQMPEAILDELARSGDFLSRIGLSRVLRVNVGDLSFASDDYWPAAYKAINGNPQKIVTSPSGIEYLIESTESSTGWAAIKMTGPDGSEKRQADPVLTALLDDPGARLRALDGLRDRFDLDPEKTAAVKESLVNIEDAVSRTLTILELTGDSYHFYCEVLRARLALKPEFKLEDLLPPAFEGLLKHFRLSTEEMADPGDFRSVWAMASDGLISERSLSAVLERLTLIPVALPDSFFAAIDKMSVGERHELVVSAEQAAFSPVSLLQFLDVALHCVTKDDGASMLQIAQRICDRLAFETTAEADYRLFISLLQSVETEFYLKNEFRSMPSRARLFCVWAHASRLHNVFMRVGADPESLSGHLDSMSRLPYSAFFSDDAYSYDVLNPRNLSRAHITCLALGSIISKYQGKVDGIDKMVVFITDLVRGFFEGKSAEIMSLLANRSLFRDNLDSLLGGDRGGVLKAVVGEDLALSLATDHLTDLIAQHAEGVRLNPLSVNDWRGLTILSPGLPMPEHLASSIISAASQLNLKKLYESDALIIGPALVTMTIQLAKYATDSDCVAFVQKIAELAELFDREEPALTGEGQGEVAILDPFPTLVQAAYWLSCRHKDERESILDFSSQLTVLINRAPKRSLRLAPLLWHFITGLPAGRLHGMWKAFLSLRARLSSVK